jgi:hypothetical protein
MDRRQQRTALADVAACTAAAAHRRDHDHAVASASCHPHAVEVIHLGHSAVTVCHDCRMDTGFLPERQAEHIASGHRSQTLVESVPLPRPPLD